MNLLPGPVRARRRAGVCGLALAVVARTPRRTPVGSPLSPAETGRPDDGEKRRLSRRSPAPGSIPPLVSDVLQLAADTRDDARRRSSSSGRRGAIPSTSRWRRRSRNPRRESQGEAVSAVADGKSLTLEAPLAVHRSQRARIHPAAIRHRVALGKIFQAGHHLHHRDAAGCRAAVAGRGPARNAQRRSRPRPRGNRQARRPRRPRADAGRGDRLEGTEQRPAARVSGSARFVITSSNVLPIPTRALADFQGWLASITGPESQDRRSFFSPPRWAGSANCATRPSGTAPLVYTWDDSAAELAADRNHRAAQGKARRRHAALHDRHGGDLPAHARRSTRR